MPKRVLTTHTGSLPRPPALIEEIAAAEKGTLADPDAFHRHVREAVADVVKKQADAGIDVVSDGEEGKPGYSTYIKDRCTGFEGESRNLNVQGEAKDYPEWASRRPVPGFMRPTCIGPIAWKDFDAVKRDIANLKAATAGVNVEDVFMTSASPGVIAIFLGNEHYPSHEAYLEAIANVMKDEYKAIVDAGFLLQLDCPDLAMSRHNRYSEWSLEQFRKLVAQHVEVLNAATAGLPSDRMRLHLCWGNYEGPHHMDVPLRDIIDIVLKSNAAQISFEGANPRHEHEWAIWKDIKLPAGKMLVPGVIDSTTNFIEHPELVAQRIGNYASVVGAENVMASSDCGFGTFAGTSTVDPKIAWAKLRSLGEGARLANAQLS